ncbi:MAG: CRISPR-associated endoribonuclease Cas6, partial [Planctomycetota bacterium]
MRTKITLSADKAGIIDFNYQHQIQAMIYGFLSRSNPDYAQWLHQQGFIYKKDKRFKFFVFSGITFDGPIKIIRLNSLSGLNCLIRRNGFSFNASQTNPFTFSFQIASP